MLSTMFDVVLEIHEDYLDVEVEDVVVDGYVVAAFVAVVAVADALEIPALNDDDDDDDDDDDGNDDVSGDAAALVRERKNVAVREVDVVDDVKVKVVDVVEVEEDG